MRWDGKAAYCRRETGWSVDWGDGSSPQWVSPGAGGSAVVTHAFPDGYEGPGVTYVAHAQQSTYGPSSTYTGNFGLTVNNVAPTLGISGDAVTVGDTFTLNRSYSDPGADTVDHWTIDWGDGGSAETVSGNPAHFTHVYAQQGTYTVSAVCFDEDAPGGWSAPTAAAVVKPLSMKSDSAGLTLARPAQGQTTTSANFNVTTVDGNGNAVTPRYPTIIVKKANGDVVLTATANVAGPEDGKFICSITLSDSTMATGDYTIWISDGNDNTVQATTMTLTVTN